MRFSPFCAVWLLCFFALFVFASWASKLTGSWMSKEEGLEPGLRLRTHRPPPATSGPHKAVTTQLQPRVSLFACFTMKVFPIGPLLVTRVHTGTLPWPWSYSFSGCSVPFLRPPPLIHASHSSVWKVRGTWRPAATEPWETKQTKKKKTMLNVTFLLD